MIDNGKHEWDALGEWWLNELAGDRAYDDEITPMVLDLAGPISGTVLDVGCGEGRLMKALSDHGAHPVGVDVALDLLGAARDVGPVVLARLPSLECFADDSFDGAIISLVLEHIPDEAALLAELARVVRHGGSLALVMNHPIYTAPESGPITDDDGEVLWRPGRYFDRGHTDEPAGRDMIRFHHRPLAALLTEAAASGWSLERLEERGVTASQIDRYPLLAAQRHVPRLLGIRWVRA